MREQVGNCPKCGAPIWLRDKTGMMNKILDYDNPIFTCKCREVKSGLN